MELFDSHAHLNDSAFDTDREDVIKKTFSAGVTKIVEIACVPSDWEKALSLVRGYPGRILCACGVHPHDCGSFNESEKSRLLELFRKNRIAALGEVGLDYARDIHPRDLQKSLFLEMLKIAGMVKKPVILHCRNGKKDSDAYSDLFEALKEWSPQKGRRFTGVLHCFSGSQADAFTALDMGLALGINGTITYPKNGELREIVRKAGLENILLETDCPYLPPQSIRGKRNDPSSIPEIAAALAGFLEVPSERVADVTTKNSADLFLENV